MIGKTDRRFTSIKRSLQAFHCVPLCSTWLKVCLLLVLTIKLASISACTKGTSADAATAAPKSESSASTPASDPVPPAVSVSDNAPLPHIDAKRAFQYTREVTAFGERYMGSENHKKLERYIYDHLKGDQVEDDAFTADTVEGKFPVRNIIAKFPGTKDGIIVILGHYDTVYPLRNTGFVGANDGGSSTAILLEYANHLRGGAPGKKRDTIEEDHERDRQLIAHYIADRVPGSIEQFTRDGKTYARVADYQKMRLGVGMLLTELMRIKAEGDYEIGRAHV